MDSCCCIENCEHIIEKLGEIDQGRFVRKLVCCQALGMKAKLFCIILDSFSANCHVLDDALRLPSAISKSDPAGGTGKNGI